MSLDYQKRRIVQDLDRRQRGKCKCGREACTNTISSNAWVNAHTPLLYCESCARAINKYNPGFCRPEEIALSDQFLQETGIHGSDLISQLRSLIQRVAGAGVAAAPKHPEWYQTNVTNPRDHVDYCQTRHQWEIVLESGDTLDCQCCTEHTVLLVPQKYSNYLKLTNLDELRQFYPYI